MHVVHARLVAEQLRAEPLLHLQHRRGDVDEHLGRGPKDLLGPVVGVTVEVEQHQLVHRLDPEDDDRFDVPGPDPRRTRTSTRSLPARWPLSASSVVRCTRVLWRHAADGRSAASTSALPSDSLAAPRSPRLRKWPARRWYPCTREVGSTSVLGEADDLVGRDDDGVDLRPTLRRRSSG